MKTNELEKSVVHLTVGLIEYVPHSVVTQTILKKLTGSISVMSFDKGEGQAEKISPFDSYAQIIDGQAEVVIDGNSFILKIGQSIIIPAHKSNYIKAHGRFKMISTIIKSGYEQEFLM